MTSGSDVSKVNNKIDSISSGITNVFANISNSWKGKSKDSILNKVEKSLTELFTTISKQLELLESAVEKAKKYKELKEEFERLQKMYFAALNDEEKAAEAQKIYQQMEKIKKEMDELKRAIQSLINSIAGMDITSTNSNTKISASRSSSNSSTSSSNKKTSNSNKESGVKSLSGKRKIIEKAEEIHQYMEDNNYSYCVYDNSRKYEECDDLGKNHGLNKTFEESKTGYHNTCCATYVSWVLQETGYLSRSEHTDGANNLASTLKGKGWIRVPADELEPGDVMVFNNHVQIYGDDAKIYNAGSGSSIRGEVTPNSGKKNCDYGLRAPE